MLQTILSNLGLILPALIAFNVVLSALSGFLGAIHQAKAEEIVGKIAGGLKALVDVIQGNLKH